MYSFPLFNYHSRNFTTSNHLLCHRVERYSYTCIPFSTYGLLYARSEKKNVHARARTEKGREKMDSRHATDTRATSTLFISDDKYITTHIRSEHIRTTSTTTTTHLSSWYLLWPICETHVATHLLPDYYNTLRIIRGPERGPSPCQITLPSSRRNPGTYDFSDHIFR